MNQMCQCCGKLQDQEHRVGQINITSDEGLRRIYYLCPVCMERTIDALQKMVSNQEYNCIKIEDSPIRRDGAVVAR